MSTQILLNAIRAARKTGRNGLLGRPPMRLALPGGGASSALFRMTRRGSDPERPVNLWIPEGEIARQQPGWHDPLT